MVNMCASDANMSVLVVAAHPDDEVLGCGGTLARFAREGRQVHVLLMTDGEGARGREKAADNQGPCRARNAAAKQACDILGVKSIKTYGFPDNRMDGVDLLDVIKIIELNIERCKPSLVITHHSGDVNIDHCIVHSAVMAATRPQPGHVVNEVWFYEIPSSTEWNTPGSKQAFHPNLFVDVTDTIDHKYKALHAYEAEMRSFPHARSVKAIESLASWRGATVGVKAAEAFVLGRKKI